MICKECGAYNPDHATYCKVCAANLKGEPAAAETPAAAEEEIQPTKRFSRPSWVVPGQSKKVEDIVSDASEEAAEQLTEAVEETVSEAAPVVSKDEKAVENAEEAVEDVREAWTPVPAKHRAVQREEKSEEIEETEADAADPEEEYYNDEEALMDEDESFEYEPTPPKRKQAKKKQSTLFTVLLISIIVVIVGALVAFMLWFLKEKDVIKCDKAANTDSTSSSQPIDPDQPVDPSKQEETPAPSNFDERNAELTEKNEDGKDTIHIKVMIPSKATVTIDFPHQTDYSYTNNSDSSEARNIKIPVEIFYPNTPVDEQTQTFTPDIKITNADGSEYKVNCPSFTRTFPKLNITVSAPVPDENGMIMASESNTLSFQGTIDDPNATLTMNGTEQTVYAGGVFMFDYAMRPDATEDSEETVTLVASMPNCVSDTKEITVHAYKFVPDPMTLEVKSDIASLRADKSGKLIVTGKTLPGATLTATSDNATNVLCGSVTVDGDGNFSFQITMDPTFYGMSVITLNAVKEGCEDGSVQFTVLKGHADKQAFVSYYLKNKTYREVKQSGDNAISIAELIANPTQYAGSAYGIRLTGTVVEVNTVGDDTIVKMTILKTNETVYVHALSTVWLHTVGEKYNVYCNFIGTYGDTGCAEFYGWFAKNK